VSEYSIDLNLNSEKLDLVSTELSAALQKIVTATNNANNGKKQDINLDLSKAFLPFNDSVKFAALSVSGLGKNVVAVSKELAILKTKLADLSSSASASKATGKGTLNVNANTKIDTAGLELSVKGTKEIDLSKINVDTSKVKVVLTNTDIKLDAQIDGKINVEPVNLKLNGLIQKELAKTLTVGAVSLEKVLNDQVKAALKGANVGLVTGTIDLTDAVKKLSDDLNLEITNAGDGFNLAKAVTDLELKLNSLINQATSSVSEVNISPVNLKISGLIQGKINENLTVGDITLGSSFGAGLKKAITEAISIENISVSLDLQPSIDVLVKDLSVKFSSAAESFNISNAVSDLEKSLVNLINDAKPTKLKTKLTEEVRKSAVKIPDAIPVKLLVPKEVAVKGIVQDIPAIKVRVQTPEEIQIESELTADFIKALSQVKVKLAANAEKLITELDSFDVSATDITDVVEGFLTDVVNQFRAALKVSDTSELTSIVSAVKSAASAGTGTDLKEELTKLSNSLASQIIAAGGSFEIKESIEKLNAEINNDVNSIDFDFASAFKSLNLKFQNSVESISFKIDPIELAVNALFGKIETALNSVETKGVSGSNAVSSAIDSTREKELIQRSLFQKVIPAFQESRNLGEIQTGKINGSTKEGKSRNALVEQKANAALTILSKVSSDVENLGRAEAEAIANLVGELENVFEDLTPATAEAKMLVSAVKAGADQLAEKSSILKNSLASERESGFSPLTLSDTTTGAIRIRKPKEATKVIPNEAKIEGGSPAQIKKANQLVSKETEELAFDLRILNKQISNPAIAAALSNFANLVEGTALILGKTTEELAQIDPGFLRNSLQQSLAAEGVKFTASQGLGFGQQDIAGTAPEGMTGIEGILNVLASFTTDFVQAQLGNTTENQDAFAQFERAGKEFAGYVGQAGVELYNNPAAKAAAAAFGDNLKKSATSAANIYRSAQRIEDATLGVFGIFGKAAKFSIQAVAAQTTLGNLGLGGAGSFLGEGVSGLAGAAGSLAKANTAAFGSGVTIDVITTAIKAAAPLIGLGIATGIATKSIDQAIPNNNPEITELEAKLTNLGQDLAEITKATAKSEIKAQLGTKEEIQVEPPQKSAEPDLVEVVKPPEIKKNEEVATKKAAERPVEDVKGKDKGKGKDKDPQETPSEVPKSKGKNKTEPELSNKPEKTEAGINFKEDFKALKDELSRLALVAKASGTKADLNEFSDKSKEGLATLRPAKSARSAEATEQRKALDAEASRTSLRLSGLTKLTTLKPETAGGRAEFNRASKTVSDNIGLGDLKEAQLVLSKTKKTVVDKAVGGEVDPAIKRSLDKLQVQIDDESLKQEVSKLTEEIKKGKLTGSADIASLTTAAEKISNSSSKDSGSASQDLLLSIRSLDKALTGLKTKDFKEAVSIAGTQSKLGEFDNAKATLQNARNLASGELQNNQVSVAELAIDTSDLKSIFDRFLGQVTKLDLAGVSDQGIADLKASATKFVNFPDLALKARNKIDGLQSKLDKSAPKPVDSFGLNFKSAQSELSVGQLEAAKSFLLVADSFAKGREEINKVVALFADIRVEEIKSKVKGVTDQISELKLSGVTADGIQKVKSQVGSVGDKDAESKLLLTLKGLEKSIPKENKENKVKSEFGELISALKKEKALGKPLSSDDLNKITSLAVTRNQKAAVDQLVVVKEPKPVKPVDEFPAQAKLVRNQISNNNVQEADVEKLKTLAKTKNQAEELLTVLNKIEKVSIDRAFVAFKKEAEVLLNSGNKISESQAAVIEQSAKKFEGTSKGDATAKIVGQIKDGLDPFKLLAQDIKNSLKDGKVAEPGKLDNLARLAKTDTEQATVKGLREETKQVRIGNEFSAFKDAVETFKNSNDKSATAIKSVKEGAALFQGTDKEIQANTISRRFQGKPADAFREELRLQELNKTNNRTVDSTKLNQLASTDIEKALVLKLESALDKANFDIVFKEFSDLVKSAINDVKNGTQNPETLNQIKESSSLFAGTPKEVEAVSQSLSLQSVIEADQNRKFKAAKTSVSQNLPDADRAIQFIKDLSESSSKLANQAKGFLSLKDSSALLAGFTEEITQVQRALKQKGANVPELQSKLADIGDRFSASAVVDNKAVDSRLFSAVNQSIGLESGQQAADFTKGNQLVKLGRTEEARKIFEELANDATSTGRQAQLALNKLDEVFVGLTKGEEQLLRELAAKFSSIKATSKNTGDLSGLKELAKSSGQQNQTIQGSDRTDLFKDRFNKIAQDVEAAANPKSAAEKEINRSTKDLGLTDLKSGFDLIKGSLQSAVEGLKTLATAASVTSINIAKLDLANKGAVGQTAKDFQFAKDQAKSTGIGEQATLRNLAEFKLAIPGADQLDSNGNRVTQSVGTKEVETIVKGLQSAGTANQLSGDEQAGASNAVLQILSKGQVQSEELKRQLANFLPGTVSTFAQSQGITTAELEGRLKRGEVGIDALVGFAELLETKFGKISQQNTPTKAVNTLTGNLQEVGIKASAPGGVAIQAGLGVVNPLLSGVKDSASSLTTAASGIGLIIGAKFAQEAATKIGATSQLGDVLKKTASLFVLDPNSSIKEQVFARKFSALGKVAGLTLGAGLLTSVVSALSGAEGLDSLFAKSTKNLQFLLSGIKLPGFGDKDKDPTGAAKNTLLADTFTQIIPAALLFGAAIQGLTGVIEKTGARLKTDELKTISNTIAPDTLASKTAASEAKVSRQIKEAFKKVEPPTPSSVPVLPKAVSNVNYEKALNAKPNSGNLASKFLSDGSLNREFEKALNAKSAPSLPDSRFPSDGMIIRGSNINPRPEPLNARQVAKPFTDATLGGKSQAAFNNQGFKSFNSNTISNLSRNNVNGFIGKGIDLSKVEAAIEAISRVSFNQAKDAQPNSGNRFQSKFLSDVALDKDLERSKEQFNRAKNAKPDTGNRFQSKFLSDVSLDKDKERAKEQFNQAKNAKPNAGNNFQSKFLSDIALDRDVERSKDQFNKALNAKPNTGNRFQSKFLSDGPLDKNIERPKDQFNKALNAKPNTGNSFQSKFLSDGPLDKDIERSKEQYRKALNAKPTGNLFESKFLSDGMISGAYSAPKTEPKSKTAFGSVNNQAFSTPKVDKVAGVASSVSAGASALGGAALGLLANPLTTVIAPLVLALGAYGLSTVKFQSEYADAADKQIKELRDNTDQLRKNNGNKEGSFGARQSEDKGAFGINIADQNARDQNVLDQITGGEAKIDLVSNFGLRTERDRAKKAVDAGQDFEEGFLGFGQKDNRKVLATVNKEISERSAGKAPSEEFKAVTASTGLFIKDLEASALELQAFKENLIEASKATVLSKEDAAKLATDKSTLANQESQIKTLLEAAPSKDVETNKQRALQLTDAKSKAQEARKAVLDLEVTPARKKVSNLEDIQKKQIAARDLKLDSTRKNNEELLTDPAFLKDIAERNKQIKEAGDAVKAAKEDLAQKDPSVKLAKAATVRENADNLTERSAQARSLNLSGEEKTSIDLRGTEGNDRASSIRNAELGTKTAVSDLQTLEEKLSNARNQQAVIQLNSLSDDYDEKITAANKEVLALQLETEKKRTEIASSKLSERIAIEAKLSEEADRKRLKQERKLNTQEAQGQLSNTVDANFQFNINNSRLSEAAAIRQEDVAKKQVKDQETVVKQTVVGKEAQQDKLDDLKVASIQKSAARQAAVRSRREAEENRLLEVADIATNNRNRSLTNQNSLASRVQQTFSPADQVRSAIQTEQASSRNSDAARIDIEKQILTLSQTRFGREQQSQKLEDLKSSKLQKDTDLYLAQLARVRAEYELLSTVIANTRAAREALSSAKTQTAENRNEVKFQNKTGAIANDLAGTDTSARDNKAKTEQLQANRRTQDGSDRVAAAGLASDLTTKLRKLGSTVDFGIAAKPALNATPVQLEKKISAVDSSLRQITLKRAQGDQSAVNVNDGGIKFRTNSIEAVQAYKEFLESFRTASAKKEADNLAIFSSKKNEEKGSIERASNSQRNTEQSQIETKISVKTEEDNRNSVRARQKDRVASLQDQDDDPLTTSTRATVTALKTETNQKILSDAVLTTDSNKKVRTLTANRDQALAAGQGDEANKLGLEITAEIGKLQSSLASNNFSTLESGIDNIFAELKKQTSSSERIAELNQEQLNRTRSVFDLRKGLGLVEESDKDASSREIGNKIDDSNTAVSKARRDLNKESTPSKVIGNLKSLDEATKANPVLNSLAREALRVAETLAKSGKLTGSAISDIISSLDSLTISATEKAVAIKFAADKIDRANSLEKNQAESDIQDSSDAITEKRTTGRFSGIENSSVGNESKRRKINTAFSLKIQAIDNEEFANRDNLTQEQKQVKFGSKREIAKNNRDLDLDEIKSDSRKLAGDISEIITSNLKFDQFFKDVFTDGDISKAASRIGESLFDGLANYFSQKAQKSLNDVIGSFFENIFDSIFGIVKDKAKGAVNPVKSALSSEIQAFPLPSVALASDPALVKMAVPKEIPVLESQSLPIPALKDIPQVESFPAPSVVVDPELVGKAIVEATPETPEVLTEPYPQPFYDLGANGVGTPVPDADYVPVPETGKPFFFPDFLGEKLDTDNNDDYDWRNDLEGKAQPISNASGDWMNQEVENIRDSTRNSEALEANTQALLNSKTAREDIPGVPSMGGFESTVDSFEPLSESITSGLTGSNLAEDSAFTNNLPSTIDSITPALNLFKSGLESTQDPLLSFGASLLSVLSGSSGGGGGGIGGLLSGALGGLFGGGGGSVGDITGGSLLSGSSFGIGDLPSFADGTIREASNMPRTPGGKDLRERGADSRLAVLNAQELVVPAGLAQDFLAFKSNQDISNSLVNNNNSTSNSTSNSTINNSYSIQSDSFGRSGSAQTVIADPVSNTRKRFNTNR
jgi:tape measure domain-containing protein